MKRVLLAATLLAVPLAAQAQPIQGVYVGAAGGANWLLDNEVRVHTGPLAGPTVDSGAKAGEVALGSIGWAFGNGVRVEAEGSWRRNTGMAFGLTQRKFGAMANVLFDMDIGSPWVYPYAGAGAGAQEKLLIQLLAQILKAGPDRVRKHRHGAVPIPRQLLVNEALDLGPLIRG